MFDNGIYVGDMWHYRLQPKKHRFRYRVLMFCLELSDIQQTLQPYHFISTESFNWLSFYHKHHALQDKRRLIDSIPACYTGDNRDQYRFYLITQLAHFGYCYNPIRFLVITAADAEKIVAVMLLVKNTPWGEQHHYLLDNLHQSQQTYRQVFSKQLHVSPFMDMDFQYHFSLLQHAQDLQIRLQNFRQDIEYFSAGIDLQWYPLTQKNLYKLLLKHPFSTQKTIIAIYWQALKLWLKGFTFSPHP